MRIFDPYIVVLIVDFKRRTLFLAASIVVKITTSLEYKQLQNISLHNTMDCPVIRINKMVAVNFDSKLGKLKLPNRAINWIISYLTGRTQVCEM